MNPPPTPSDARTYLVEGMSCAHCTAAVRSEVTALARVESVDIDLETKLVVVRGRDLDDAAIRAAVVEAGYEAVPR